MTKEQYENLVKLAKTDYRSRLKLNSVEVVADCKNITKDSNSTVVSSIKVQTTNYIN